MAVSQLESLTARVLRDHKQRVENLTARLRHPSQQLALLQNKITINQDRATALIQSRLAASKHPLAQLNTRLQSASPSRLLKQRQETINNLSSGLPSQMAKVIRDNRRQVEHLSTLLETLGPSATLKRGYAIVTDESGKVVRSTQQVEQGDTVAVALDDGHLRARVDEKSRGNLG